MFLSPIYNYTHIVMILLFFRGFLLIFMFFVMFMHLGF
jgi:hypothetical protein